MIFNALSSFSGVGINTLCTFFLHFTMSAFFIYLFIYLFILCFVPFHLRVGSDCLISHQQRIINLNGKIL